MAQLPWRLVCSHVASSSLEDLLSHLQHVDTQNWHHLKANKHAQHTHLYPLIVWGFYYSNYKVTAPVGVFTWLTRSRVWLCPAKVTQSHYMPVEPQTRAEPLKYHSERAVWWPAEAQSWRCHTHQTWRFSSLCCRICPCPPSFWSKETGGFVFLLFFSQRLPDREKNSLDKVQ